MFKTDLSKFDNSWYRPGGGSVKRVLWYFVNALFMNSAVFPFSGVKVVLLRIFGARIGRGVNIKPRVNIKYPWRLVVGDYAWIGENVWIDNLDTVTIGDHVCISQGALLLCGNHDYKKESFDLITGSIQLDEGVWIGARSVVCPGVHCKSHSVLGVGSVAGKDMEAYGIYRGNPAIWVRKRIN